MNIQSKIALFLLFITATTNMPMDLHPLWVIPNEKIDQLTLTGPSIVAFDYTINTVNPSGNINIKLYLTELLSIHTNNENRRLATFKGSKTRGIAFDYCNKIFFWLSANLFFTENQIPKELVYAFNKGLVFVQINDQGELTRKRKTQKILLFYPGEFFSIWNRKEQEILNIPCL